MFDALDSELVTLIKFNPLLFALQEEAMQVTYDRKKVPVRSLLKDFLIYQPFHFSKRRTHFD